jgi:Polyketide cyclase / dehydrase and lipid transport
MATIIRTVTIDNNASIVWDALRDFGALHQRLAPGFITDCRMKTTDVRVVTFFSGAVATEQLIGLDDDSRRLAYSIVDSALNMTHHNAAAQVSDDGDGRTIFTWTVDLLPDGCGAPVGRLMDAGLAAIKANLDRVGSVS